MTLPLRFKCRTCNLWHEGLPGWSWPFPIAYFDVPEAQRGARCFLNSEVCVVDDARFFVRGCLELPVVGVAGKLSIGAWVELEELEFFQFQDLLDTDLRADFEPFEGRLNVPVPTYPETLGLKVLLELRDHGERPLILVTDSTHPLHAEQASAATQDRIQALYDYFEHRVRG